MSYIFAAPGSANDIVLTLSIASNGTDTGFEVPALQDISASAANDSFVWTQLDQSSKLQVATTATNSISMNLVVDQTTFFGDALATAGTAAEIGVMGLSTEKTRVKFTLFMGNSSDGTAGKTLTGYGYITGLTLTTSADAPIWVSPITISMDSDYTVS